MNRGRDTQGPIGQLEFGRATRVRKEGSRVWEEPIVRRQRETTPDDLLAGVSAFDLSGGGGTNGIGRYAAKLGGTGAGPDVTYDHRPASNYDLGFGGCGGSHLSGTYDTDEDFGSSDLFGQPARRHQVRDEYGDFVTGDDGAQAPGHEDADYATERDFFEDALSGPVEQLHPRRYPRPDPRSPRDGTFARRRFRR